jgi:hypothetical protein
VKSATGVLAALGLGLGLPAAAGAPDEPNPRADRGRFFDAETRAAVDRGLAWLVAKQNPNGSWTNRVGYKLYDDYYGEENDSVDVTAIAGMALLAGGNVPGRGKYGGHIRRAVDWLLSKVRDEDGYVSHAGSRMYSHAFATLFLAEIYGMTRQEVIKPKLKRAVDLIVGSQNREGGWRYQPIPVDADLSVTVSTLQALRAARNVGVSVPLDTIQRATRYVENCATRRGFTYQSVAGYGISDTRVSFALTACGLVSLFSAGQYDSFRVRDAVRALGQWRNTVIPGKLHYYYGHYYACQAMYLVGGEKWTEYYPSVRNEILKMQMTDGHWEDDVGPAYATAMACVILQIPCEYLPIFQK